MSEREVELTSEMRAAVKRASRVNGWIHLVEYAGMSPEWMDLTLEGIVRVAIGDLAVRLADAKARAEAALRLADEWEQATCITDGAPCSFHRHASGYANDLREALRGDQ